jgi:hypothetical protein
MPAVANRPPPNIIARYQRAQVAEIPRGDMLTETFGAAIVPGMVLTSSQREALNRLANAGEGCTVPALVRSGCAVEELRDLARSRLAIAERVRGPGTLRAPTVIRIRISDAGRKALARQDGRANRRKISARLVLFMLFLLGALAGVGVGALLASH